MHLQYKEGINYKKLLLIPIIKENCCHKQKGSMKPHLRGLHTPTPVKTKT